jgi:hypothetical protein
MRPAYRSMRLRSSDSPELRIVRTLCKLAMSSSTMSSLDRRPGLVSVRSSERTSLCLGASFRCLQGGDNTRHAASQRPCICMLSPRTGGVQERPENHWRSGCAVAKFVMPETDPGGIFVRRLWEWAAPSS